MTDFLEPVLETARLMLRPHRLDDFEDAVAMWGDSDVTRFIGGKPATREEVWARLLRYAGHWALLGYGYWVIRETATARFVGEIGFADFHRDIAPPFEGAPEAGWALARWAHGQGFAVEALSAILAWADGHFGAARTVCMIEPANGPSLRLAQKAGYLEYARTSYKGAPTILFERRGRKAS
jgi:RimJ/RimL family protein N-acetyltransferase